LGTSLHCYERARQARENADVTAEARWLALAESYEQHRSRTISGFEPERRADKITRMLREQHSGFDPDDAAKLIIAYHAVLIQLGLVDREDGAQTVAKRIVAFAKEGERDPERLAAATFETLANEPR
jgi:hypothetical protein